MTINLAGIDSTFLFTVIVARKRNPPVDTVTAKRIS